ncbi:MAG TPA: transporter substrate-binding domain-containing protein [Pseudomonas sp.]|nr:transporter substrate-binding domain-containing protein [Pseudomonas sp.]
MSKLLSLLLLCGLTQQALADCTLRVRVSDFKPQYYQDEDGTWRGMSIEFAETLLGEAGCKPLYLTTPWERSFELLKSGGLDLMLNLSITPEREQFLHFIGPQRDESIMLVVRREADYRIDSLDDLKKLPRGIGFESGSFYGDAFTAKFNSDPAFAAKFEAVPHAELNIHKLRHNRISAFLGDAYSVAYRIREDELYKDAKLLPYPVNQDWVYFGFSKQSVSPELLARLQNAFDRAWADGKFEAILQRYR